MFRPGRGCGGCGHDLRMAFAAGVQDSGNSIHFRMHGMIREGRDPRRGECYSCA